MVQHGKRPRLADHIEIIPGPVLMHRLQQPLKLRIHQFNLGRGDPRQMRGRRLRRLGRLIRTRRLHRCFACSRTRIHPTRKNRFPLNSGSRFLYR